MNYVLIGMPGSGKSTMGVLLAKYIGFGFVDCDLMIQSREKKLLSEIIEFEGVERFIEIENDVLSCLCVDRCIIATGGSAVYGEEAMATMKNLQGLRRLCRKLSRESNNKQTGNYKIFIRSAQKSTQMFTKV